MIILNKTNKTSDTVSIRTLGLDYNIPLHEAERYVETGQLMWKANKPVTPKEFANFVGVTA